MVTITKTQEQIRADVNSKKNIFIPQAQQNKIKAGLPSSAEPTDVNKFVPKANVSSMSPERKALIQKQSAEMGAAAAIKQGQKPGAGAVYDPDAALQGTDPTPVSPFVQPKKEEPTNPSPATGSPTASTPGGATDYTVQATGDLKPGFDQWEKDNGKLFDMADNLKDEKIQSYEDLYGRQLERLDQLKDIMDDLTLKKNAIIAGSADVQNAEIEAAYKNNEETLRIAKERLDETQRQTLSEREKQLDRKKMNEENMLAVIGGFGSMAGNKVLLDSVEAGEQAMGVLKTEFSFQDQEHSAKVVALNNDYKNDKLKVEQWKQEQIQTNFQSLQDFIADTINKEDMADEEKVKAINAAKDQYNNAVASISKQVIDARFELSRDIISRADTLRKEAETKAAKTSAEMEKSVETARNDLSLLAENYSLGDYSALSDDIKNKFDELEKKAGLPKGFTEQAIKNVQAQNKGSDMQIMSQLDNNGNWTIIGVDKKTGQVTATSTLKGAGKTTSVTAKDPVEKAFGVGEVGGWCGDFASRVSTASQVGNTWPEKLAKVDKRTNPKPGDKCVIPLGVTDNGDYGHVFVVLAYNPETGVIKSLESNKDGAQNRGGVGMVSIGEYNLNDLQEEYGENWGFISGKLKGQYKLAAEKYGFTEKTSANTPADPYADIFNETPQAPVADTTPPATDTTNNTEDNYDTMFSDYAQ